MLARIAAALSGWLLAWQTASGMPRDEGRAWEARFRTSVRAGRCPLTPSTPVSACSLAAVCSCRTSPEWSPRADSR